jgi:hypothetical protein
MPDANSWDLTTTVKYDVPYVNRKNVAGMDLASFGPAPSPIPPVISNISPTTITQIGPYQVLSFDVTDEEDSFKRIIIVAEFPTSKIKEIVFDGEGFGPMYANGLNQQQSIVNGYNFEILRDGGWPESPTLTPFALDTTGGENA